LKPQRLLIFNFKFMGDLLIATAVFASLRRVFPSTHIAVVVRKEYAEVLAGNPDVDELIVFDRTKMRSLQGWKRAKFEWGFLKRLRQGRFDVSYAMHPGDRTCWWSWLSGAKSRIGTSAQPLGFLLNKTVAIAEPHLDGRDYLDYYYALADPFGLEEKIRKTSYALSEETRRAALRNFPEVVRSSGNPLIGIHPGASAPARQWPWERFSRLANELMVTLQARVLIFAGPGEEELAHMVLEQIQGRDKSMVMPSGLAEFAACLERCDLFVGNDTGPRHLAVALGVPTIALMGQKDVKVWGIYSERDKHWVIQKKVPCQPCEKTFCDDMVCLTAIPVEEVAALAQKVLKETAKAGEPLSASVRA
jgi:heptosyltransferase-2